MTRMAWRMLAHRPMGFVATWLALWFAVAVVTTCGVLLESGVRYHGTTARYAAAPVLVAVTNISTTQGSGEERQVNNSPLAEPGRLDRTLRHMIADAPGVRAAIADAAVPAAVHANGVHVSVQLHPWSAARLGPFRLVAGSAPTDPNEVVLDRDTAASLGGARPGTHLVLDMPSGPRHATVTGVAAPEAGTPDDVTAFVDDAVLSGVAPQVIGVVPEPGVSAATLASHVQHVLPPRPADPFGAYPHVFTGADRGAAESIGVGNDRELVVALSSVFGGCTLLIAILVIAGTVGLAVAQRHRDIALLRAIAATPRQVRRMVVREVVVIAVLAVAAGIWPGIAGAGLLRDQFVGRGLVADTFHVHVSWLPPLVAGAAGLLIAALAAWIASLRASRIRPLQALGEAAVERRGIGVLRAVLGLIALAGGITLCRVAGSTNGDGAAGVSVATVATLVIAAALLSPLLIRATAALLGPGLRALGVPGRLAAATTETSARRLSPVVSSLVLAVALGGSLWFVQTSELHVSAQQSRAGLVADHVVLSAAPGLDARTVSAVRHTDGVLAATPVVHGTIFSGRSEANGNTALGIVPAGIGRTIDLGVTAGRLGALRGNAVAVDTLTAQALDLRVGSAFRGWFGDGARADLRVVAIYERGLGFAQFTLPHDLLARHGSGFDDALFIATQPDRPQVLTTVRHELDRLAPGARVVGRGAYQAGLDEDLAQNAWANQMITGVLLVYVVIAAANSLVTYALGRRREFAMLRLSGTTRLQVLRMVRLEQIVLLGLALVVGAAIAAATLLPMVEAVTGSAAPYVPLGGWIAVIGGLVALGTVATTIPVRRVLRASPVADIGVRE